MGADGGTAKTGLSPEVKTSLFFLEIDPLQTSEPHFRNTIAPLENLVRQ